MHVNKKFINTSEYVICTNNFNTVNLGIVENFNPHNPNTNIPSDINFYPIQSNDYNLLINEICNYVNVEPNQILLTNGSGKGLDLILQAFTTPETNILIPIPNYPGFIHSAEISNGNIKYFNFTGNESEELMLDSLIQESNMVYFSSPNLPLGYSINYNNINQYILNNPHILFIIDEAYFEYGSNISFASLTNIYTNLIVVRTFSKAFALAGARIGYLIANPLTIKTLRIGYNAKDILNSSIKYALDVLNNKQYYLDNVKQDLDLIKFIKNELSLIIKKNLVIYDFNTFDAPWFLIKTKLHKHVCNIMQKNGYLVRDKSDDIKDCVRISLCTKEHIIKVIDIIKNINESKYDHIYIDLDGTLRHNNKTPISKPLIEQLHNLQKKYDITILTDNSSNHEDIKNYLLENNISCSLISPINKMMNPDNKKWFVYDDCVYIIQFPEITPDLMNCINKFNKIRVIETDTSINSFELGFNCNITMPHIGSFLSIINNPNIEIIGKTKLIMSNYNNNSMNKITSLVIGDSHNDESFAKNNNFNFIKVSNTEETIKILEHM